MTSSLTISVTSTGIIVTLRNARPWWQWWMPRHFFVVLTRAETVRLRNLLGGALARGTVARL